MRSIQSAEVAGASAPLTPSPDADGDELRSAGSRMAEPIRWASQYIGPKVNGLETRVQRMAIGRFARSRIAAAAANGICATPIMIPKNTPSAAPLATVRRLRCHSHSRSISGPSQRSARRLRTSSRVGTKPRNLCQNPLTRTARERARPQVAFKADSVFMMPHARFRAPRCAARAAHRAKRQCRAGVERSRCLPAVAPLRYVPAESH